MFLTDSVTADILYTLTIFLFCYQ